MWYNGAGGDFLTHLLVVDDEVSILELIKNSLGKDGYLITVCQNADDVDIKKLHFYDLILLDVMMPGTDGFEFCKQIRNMVDCPILFLTAKTYCLDWASVRMIILRNLFVFRSFAPVSRHIYAEKKGSITAHFHLSLI